MSYRLAPQVAWVPADGGLFVLRLRTDAVPVFLGGPAAVILAAALGATGPEAVIARAAADASVPAEEIAADVHAFLAELIAAGYLIDTAD